MTLSAIAGILAFMINSQAELNAPLMADSYPPRESLQAFCGARDLSWESIAYGGVPEDVDVLVWSCHSRELPEAARDEAVKQEVRRFVEQGGGLFLVGFAAAWATELGLEPARPDSLRWAGTLRRTWSCGIQTSDPHPLFAGLTPTEALDSTIFFIGSSDYQKLECATWKPESLEHGTVVGQLVHHIVRGGVSPEKLAQADNYLATGEANLIEWRLGQGKVLALGNSLNLKEHWCSDWTRNLRLFLTNASRWLSARPRPVIAALPAEPAKVHVDHVMSTPTHPEVQPHWFERSAPGVPYIGHWGWHGQLNYLRAELEPVGPEYFQRRIIDEPYRWGANLLEFYPLVLDAQGNENIQYTFPWRSDDPIPRDPTYKPYTTELWDWEMTRQLIARAHERDFIIHAFNHTRPVESYEGNMDFVELQARELQNPLLFGADETMDGIGFESWYNDGETLGRAWTFNPGSYLHSTQNFTARTPAFSQTLACSVGRNGGVYNCGSADQYVYIHHPPLALSYQADCRANMTSYRVWGEWSAFGGGTHPDWIMRQAHVWARDRMYLDSAFWWLGEDAVMTPDEYRPYIYGISADPLRCAVAMRLLSTGIGGHRDQCARVYSPRREWVNLTPYPADSAVVQNNYFRLVRLAGEDRGILQYDPTRTAFFHHTNRPEDTVEISAHFLSTIPQGERDETIVELNQPGAFRGEGGYEPAVVCDAEKSSFPRKLAYENDPLWPSEAELHFQAGPGRYLLEVDAAPEAAIGVVQVHVDGELIGFYMTKAPETQYRVPFSLTDDGDHRITLRVERVVRPTDSWAAHSFDALRIRKVGATGVRHEMVRGAGHSALLIETAASDTGERSVRRYQADSDWPVLHVQLEGDSTDEMAFDLPAHQNPEPLPGVAAAWQLAPREPGAPALLLFAGAADAQIQRQESRVIVSLRGEGGDAPKLALVINDGFYGAQQLPALREALFADRQTLRPEKESPAAIQNAFDFPKVEVVEVANPAGGPYLVCETGADGSALWTVRGAQPIDAGARDLLKVYLQPGAEARVQPYGFIEGIVKPAWGCQYMLGIGANIEQRRCEVEVIKTGPFIFAPRIEWAEPFSSVRVNGQPWQYFEGRCVMLPNRPGRYVVEVDGAGDPAPRLARTWLDVERAEWQMERRTLVIKASHPHWWEGPLGGDRPYTALIRSDQPPQSVEGAGEQIPWSEYRVESDQRAAMETEGFLLRIRPGETRIRF